MNERAETLGRIAAAVQDLINRGSPPGAREPRRPPFPRGDLWELWISPDAPPGWRSEEDPGEPEYFADPLGLSAHRLTGSWTYNVDRDEVTEHTRYD